MSLRPRREKSANAPAPVPASNESRASELIQRASAMRATASESPADKTPVATLDQLTPVEQAVVALDVDPHALKPIEWLNKAHYDTLKKSNSLAPDLQRRIEAYRHVSTTDTTPA